VSHLHNIARIKGRGFSLVELLIAIAVFTFLIIPIVNLFEMISFMGARSRNEIIAAGLATRRMEEFKCTPFKSLCTYLDNLGGTFDSGIKEIPGFEGYKEQVEVYYYPNKVPVEVPDKYRVSIKVTIQWEQPRTRRIKDHVLFSVVTSKKPFI
jgi:prepilin-type N-terminal cleavage/methylation domain-containing protein